MRKTLMGLVALAAMTSGAFAGEPLVYGPFGTEDDVVIDKVEPTIFPGVSLTFGETAAVADDCVAVYRKSNDQLCGLGKVIVYRGRPQLTLSMQVTGGTEVYFRGWQKASGVTANLQASLNGAAAATTILMPESGSVDSVLALSAVTPAPVPPAEPEPLYEGDFRGDPDDVTIDKVEPTIFSGVAMTFGGAAMAVGDKVGLYRAADDVLCGYGEVVLSKGAAQLTLSMQVKEGTVVRFVGWQASSRKAYVMRVTLGDVKNAETLAMPEPGSIVAGLSLAAAGGENPPPPPPPPPVVTNTVTFVLGPNGERTGGGELVQRVVQGGDAVAPTVVGLNGYTFKGWDVAFTDVQADLTVTAQYDAPVQPPAEPEPLYEGDFRGNPDDVTIDKVEPTIFSGVAMTFGGAAMAVGDKVGLYRAADDVLCGYGEVVLSKGAAQLTLSMQVKEGTVVRFVGWQASSRKAYVMRVTLGDVKNAETLAMPEPGSIVAGLSLAAAGGAEPPPAPPVVEPVATNAITYLNVAGAANPNPATFTTNDLPLVLKPLEREGYEFLGWAPQGGVIPAGTVTNVTFCAVWQRRRVVPVETKTIVDEETGRAREIIVLPEDEPEFTGVVAAVYDGFVMSGEGEIVGTVQVKAAKANKKTGVSKLSATVQLVGEKKLSFKGGEWGPDSEYAEMALKDGWVLTVAIGAHGLVGAFGEYEINGSANIFSAKDKETKDAVKAIEDTWVGAVNVVGDGAILSVTIAKKGKVKVSGTVNGAKISATSQLLVGAETCCIPVVIAKRANLAFNLWLRADGSVEIAGLDGAIAGKAKALKSGAAFRMDGAALARALPGLYGDYLPGGLSVAQSGAKWVVAGGAKAGKLKLIKDSSEIDREKSKFTDNMSGLKLTYKAKDGSFKGSFKAYALENGKIRSYTVNVTGVMVGDTGYGTATCKKPAASFPITVE